MAQTGGAMKSSRKCLKAQGTKDLFFSLWGGPMLDAELSCIKEGIRPDRQRGTSRAPPIWRRPIPGVTQGPGVCMAAERPPRH